MKPATLLAALACALAAAPADAQDAEDPSGRNAVSLEVGGSYVVGLWRQTSPRLRAGVEVGTAVSRLGGDGTEEDFSSLVVRPTVKLFSSPDGSVRPFTLVGAYAEGFRRRRAEEEFDTEFSYHHIEVGARVGVGMEWMPVSRIALGGHVGVRAGYVSSSVGGNSPGDRGADGWTAGTATSGITLTLFF